MASTHLTDADRVEYWQGVAERALSRQREIYAELDAMRNRALAAERQVEFLTTRRGDLVLERDAARDAVSGLISAIGNHGETTSLHEWNERMQRAVSDGKAALGRNAHADRRASQVEAA